MSDQGVSAVQVALFLVAHAVLLEDHFKALAVNGFEEAVGAVHNRLHCGRIQHDDGAAVGQLGHQVFTADLTGVVVVGSGVGYQVGHISHFGIKTEHGDVGFLQLIQAGDDAVFVNGVDEHSHNTVGDHIFDLGNLFFIAVLGIQGNQFIAVGFHNLTDSGFQGNEERIRTIHTGIADLIGHSGGTAQRQGEGQNQGNQFLHKETSFWGRCFLPDINLFADILVRF